VTGVVFFFEEYDRDVYSGRKIDLDAWNYAFKASGDIDKIIVINKTEMDLSSSLGGSYDFSVVNTIPDNISGDIVHLICPWNFAEEKISLWDYDHSADWYIFGPSNGWSSDAGIKKGVFIPQNTKVANHSIHICSTVMMHRHKVLGNQHGS
jgi:hypothetical protein